MKTWWWIYPQEGGNKQGKGVAVSNRKLGVKQEAT